MRVFICICLSVLSFFNSTAQLIYDFSKSDFVQNDAYDGKRIKPVNSNGFSRFYIRNINTFRYKVELSGYTVNYVTPIPSELQTVFRISGESSNDQNLLKGLNLFKTETNNIENSLVKISNYLTTQKDKVFNLKKVHDENQSKAEFARGAKADSLKKLVARSEDIIKVEMAKEGEAERLEEAMNKLKAGYAQFIQIAERVANIKYTKMTLINVCKQPWKDHNTMLSALPPLLGEEGMKRDYQNFINYYANARALYDDANMAADAARAAHVTVAASVEQTLKHAKEQFEEGKDLFFEDNFIKLIDDLIVLQQALQNPGYFEVASAPIQVDGDFIRFELKLTPTPVSSLMPYEIIRNVPVEIPVKGGLKVDFSVGPTISFGNNAKDEIYYVSPEDTSGNVKLLTRTNNNAISPAIAAMMHAGARSGKDWRIAGMFGVGAGFQSTDEVNFNLYGGLSGVFGKRERVMLSAGLSYLRVARLKSEEYKINGDYPVETFDIANVTEKVYKPSFFIGLSYNLTNRVEIK